MTHLVSGSYLNKHKVIEYTVINIRTEGTVKYRGVEMPNYGASLNCQLSLCDNVAALIVHSGCILLMNWRESKALCVRGGLLAPTNTDPRSMMDH
ncbi:hypothetical protein B0H13DRAFT_2306462 [Mycena leptocephala]|nr:hypothetical protein B0H13DRAFT_2306462 [Mycena leptocephala]